MLHGQYMEAQFSQDHGREADSLPVLVPRPASSLLGRTRCAVFGISPQEAEFARRGFQPTPADRRDRLENIGRSFIAGYNAAIATGQGDPALEQLSEFPQELRGFVVEGAAMGLALLDLVSPWRRRSFARFVAGAAEPYVYLAYVGAGWALARTSWRLIGRLGELDPLLRWLMMDGYGFHAGYFQPDCAIYRQRRPSLPHGYAQHAFDQGLGRALWFAMGASCESVRHWVEQFSPERRSDLWSGVGLAATYAGGASTTELRQLVSAASGSRLYVAQGAAFAAAAHLKAGSMPRHTEAACEALIGIKAEAAAAITANARPAPPGDALGVHYAAWRRGIRASIASHSSQVQAVADESEMSRVSP